jgi:transcriptional regulator with XRE-family HTH domain
MITGAQLRMARGYLRWSAKELADRAGVAESTIKRMEQDEGFPIARGANIEAVYRTLTEAGIVFLPENGGGVGIRLRKATGPIGGQRNASMPPAGPRSSSRK